MELPTPGAPNYVAALVTYLSLRPELRGWAPDGTLLALWLMTLLNRGPEGGGGGLVLDVDVRASRRPGGAAAKMARYAVCMCEGVFGLATRVLHLSEGSSTRSVALETQRACVVTGLERASAPVAIKLRREVARTGALLVWVRDEDYDGAPAWLLDQFACSIRLATLPAPVSPPPGIGTHALLPADYVADVRSLLVPTHVHPPLETYMSNLVGALALHPTLVAELSRSATATLSAFVRAHCVLSAAYTLPRGWRQAMAAWKRLEGRTATALTAGQGGMGNWAAKAGEPPRPSLVFGAQTGDWYARPDNAAAVFAAVLRHRCRVRRGGENLLYAREGSAEDRVRHCTPKAEEVDRRAARKRREDVDDDLADVLAEV